MNTLISHIKSLHNNLHLWLFQCFLISFPLSIRKVLYFYPINGHFNEYTGTYIYLSDVFLILTIIAWIFNILEHRKDFSSINNLLPPLRRFLILLLILTLWSLFSILWSSNPAVALFRAFKLIEWLLLITYLLGNVSRGTFIKQGVITIIFLGTIESLLGISQFVFQHSIGLTWLRESVISPIIPGVAKIVFDGEKYIRAYGTFPHPNVFAGFLSLSGLLSIIGLFKETFNFSLNKSKWLKVALAVQTSALILTFSKSAILGLLLATIIIFHKQLISKTALLLNSARIVPRGTTYFKQLSKILTKIAILIIAVALLLVLSKFDLKTSIIQPLSERVTYINVSRGTILTNPTIGIGIGQFVASMDAYSQKTLLAWEYQPVHNVFLLIWSELGIIGLSLFLTLIYGSFLTIFTENNIVPRGTIITSIIKVALISQMLILLFDHYHWDIQQGQIVFWLIITMPLLLLKAQENIRLK